MAILFKIKTLSFCQPNMYYKGIVLTSGYGYVNF